MIDSLRCSEETGEDTKSQIEAKQDQLSLTTDTAGSCTPIEELERQTRGFI